MLGYLFLGIGVTMLVAGIYLAFLQRSAVTIAQILTFGVLLCVIGDPRIQTLVLKSAGVEATVTLQDYKLDTVSQIATNNQKIQSLYESNTKQEILNKGISSRLDVLETKLSLPKAPIAADILSPSPAIANNNKYSILIFYKDARTDDARKIKQKLVEAGYQSATIGSSLTETTVGAQPDGSNYIVFTEQGKIILNSIESLMNQSLGRPAGEAIKNTGPYSLRRGDAQIFLY